MSPSQKHLTRLRAIAFLAICCTTATFLAHAGGPCDDNYTSAVRLLRAFYPELSHKGTNVDVQARYPLDADGPLLSFQMGVSESDQSTRIVAAPSNPSSADRVGHLSAQFQFDGRDSRIFSIFINGALTSNDKRDALNKLVNEHTNWSEAQMTDALLRAGAKFGPDQRDQLLATFPVKELEPILGKIAMGNAKFSYRGNTEPPFYAIMAWSIRFTAEKDGKRDEYTVAVEPFNGKVTSLGRRPLN